MRVLVTADLHYNHARGKALADTLIDEMNATGGDVLLVVGDTAAFDGDALEQCLSRFRFHGPKLFVAGNHELWTRGHDSYDNFRRALPQRVGTLGWQWLQSDPFISDELAIVGSIGWYDYSMAQSTLGIPRRFYAAKVSPGAVRILDGHDALLEPANDLSPQAREVVARWNDGKFVKLHRSDEQFLDELLSELGDQLDSLQHHRRILAAIHHLPFAQLLPPSHNAQWDFAKAYLGSTRIGELLLRYTNLAAVVCGHSHFPAQAHVGHIRASNIGSGYRQKHYLTLNTETDLA
jgi:Icc-related predicted phosphoesterase